MNTREEHRHAHHHHEPQHDHPRRSGERFDEGRYEDSPYERAAEPGAAQSGHRESNWRGDERAAGDAAYARTAGHTNFRGVGPKGYVRSDERITEDICERLTDDARIDASDVTVTCQSGKVTLTGDVASRAMKHLVEDVVDACSGVKEIHNRLRVHRAG